MTILKWCIRGYSYIGNNCAIIHRYINNNWAMVYGYIKKNRDPILLGVLSSIVFWGIGKFIQLPNEILAHTRPHELTGDYMLHSPQPPEPDAAHEKLAHPDIRSAEVNLTFNDFNVFGTEKAISKSGEQLSWEWQGYYKKDRIAVAYKSSSELGGSGVLLLTNATPATGPTEFRGEWVGVSCPDKGGTPTIWSCPAILEKKEDHKPDQFNTRNKEREAVREEYLSDRKCQKIVAEPKTKPEKELKKEEPCPAQKTTAPEKRSS